jgi:hypothetical protein
VRSSTPRPSPLGLALGLTLGLAMTLVPGRGARAQILMDPYNGVGMYQRQYLPYLYPSTPEPGDFFPGSGRLMERGTQTANQFRRELADIEESDLGDAGDLGAGSAFRREVGPGRSAGPGVPYYRAHRQFDQKYRRDYRPNAKVDAGFYEEQERQNDQYFRAQQEKDPKKRAKMLRQFSLERMQASRQLSTGRTQAGRPRPDAKAGDRFDPLEDPDATEEMPARLGTGAVPRPRPSIRDEGLLDGPTDRSRPLSDGLRGRNSSGLMGREPTARDRALSPIPSPLSPRAGSHLPNGLPDTLVRSRASTTTPGLTPRSSVTPPARTTPRGSIDDILERARRAREASPPARPDPDPKDRPDEN